MEVRAGDREQRNIEVSTEEELWAGNAIICRAGAGRRLSHGEGIV